MKLELKSKERTDVFVETENFLKRLNFKIVSKDSDRPWGGFFVIDEEQENEFVNLFFPSTDISSLRIGGKLSPKILVIEPGKRLSWQYHHRRAEIWKVISGHVDVVTSMTDVETNHVTLIQEEKIRIACGQRHRLVGLSEWGIVAEIWQHTDTRNPSDENDIVRVQDDFGR
jgi:mannose-6-phosphate isomerase